MFSCYYFYYWPFINEPGEDACSLFINLILPVSLKLPVTCHIWLWQWFSIRSQCGDIQHIVNDYSAWLYGDMTFGPFHPASSLSTCSRSAGDDAKVLKPTKLSDKLTCQCPSLLLTWDICGTVMYTSVWTGWQNEVEECCAMCRMTACLLLRDN